MELLTLWAAVFALLGLFFVLGLSKWSWMGWIVIVVSVIILVAAIVYTIFWGDISSMIYLFNDKSLLIAVLFVFWVELVWSLIGPVFWLTWITRIVVLIVAFVLIIYALKQLTISDPTIEVEGQLVSVLPYFVPLSVAAALLLVSVPLQGKSWLSVVFLVQALAAAGLYYLLVHHLNGDTLLPSITLGYLWEGVSQMIAFSAVAYAVMLWALPTRNKFGLAMLLTSVVLSVIAVILFH